MYVYVHKRLFAKSCPFHPPSPPPVLFEFITDLIEPEYIKVSFCRHLKSLTYVSHL